jgi:hypothetical protein
MMEMWVVAAISACVLYLVIGMLVALGLLVLQSSWALRGKWLELSEVEVWSVVVFWPFLLMLLLVIWLQDFE